MVNCENLTVYTPDTSDYRKFDIINSMSHEQWERRCVACNDCSVCDMAIHQYLLSTYRHVCVYGMSKERFEAEMSSSDCTF